eukprot:2789187-Amphidinium_carterae.1
MSRKGRQQTIGKSWHTMARMSRTGQRLLIAATTKNSNFQGSSVDNTLNTASLLKALLSN